AEVDKNDGILREVLRKILTHNKHANRLAADRRKTIELFGGFVWRRRVFLHGPEDVAALEVIAGEGNPCGRNIGLHVNDNKLSGIRVNRAHSPQELVLPLEPFHRQWIRCWPNSREAVPEAHALIGAFVDVNVITVGENVLDVDCSPEIKRISSGTFSGDKAGTV